MTRLTAIVSALAIGGLVSVTHLAGAPVLAWADPGAAQQPDHQAHHPTADQQAEAPKQEADMMQMRQKMMADMKAMDDKLDALVTKMNGAAGQAKVDAIAELVTTMVQQRAMREQMTQMQGQMMGHMMQRMAQGMSPEMQKMMADSPMMKMMMSGAGGK